MITFVFCFSTMTFHINEKPIFFFSGDEILACESSDLLLGFVRTRVLMSRSRLNNGATHGGWHFDIHRDFDTRGRQRRVLFPLWYHDQPKLVPSPQYASIKLRLYHRGRETCSCAGRHFSNPENTNVSWRLPNLYPESYDWGLPDHRLVDWPHGLMSLDRPRGLAGGHRSGHELLPRINKHKRLDMRRNRTWWNDKTLQ